MIASVCCYYECYNGRMAGSRTARKKERKEELDMWTSYVEGRTLRPYV